jgi:hypothetical protein
MDTKEFAEPWQSLPAQIISLALEHAQKKNDFDRQLAFLLLDVGVETTLKIYLSNKGKDLEYIKFPELLTSVEAELARDNLQFPLDKLPRMHKVRNKLYHQAGDIVSTEVALSTYSELAKSLLHVLFKIDIGLPNEQDIIQLVDLIRTNLVSMEANAALMTEVLYPRLAARKIEAQLRYIRVENGPDLESAPLSVRAAFAQSRLDAFNTITGLEFVEEDTELVEYIIDHPEHLYVWLAFQEVTGDDWSDDWARYQSTTQLLEPNSWRNNWMKDEEYAELYNWTALKAQSIYDWVKANIPEVKPKEYFITLSDL